jgi:hypothetical protein
MHAKFMNIGLQAPPIIPDVLSKWYVQLLHILEVIPFLISTIIDFY